MVTPESAHHDRRPTRLAVRMGALATAVLAMVAFAGALTAQTPTPTRMQAFLDALTRVLPVSLNQTDFDAPRNQERIRQSLDTIAANAHQLEAHGGESVSEAFRLITADLEKDAVRAMREFENDNRPTARFLVGKITNYCFACHSRLPGGSDLGLGREFLAEPGMEALTLRDRMTLAVAVREFDLALQLGEELLQSPQRAPQDLDLGGAVEDYLKIALRVRGSARRAAQTMTTFRGREDMPLYLAHYVDAWTASLLELAEIEPATADLARAREWIAEGSGMNEYPADRMGMVFFIAASGQLHRVVESDVPTAEKAEAYLLLGTVETSISSSPWPPEAEFYLESAIHLAPASPTAMEAYRVLEEYVTSGCTGTSGVNIPRNTQERLDTLRQIAEGT